METYIIGTIVIVLGLLWKLIKIVGTAIIGFIAIYFTIALALKLAEIITRKW